MKTAGDRNEQQALGMVNKILMRTFGRPEGLLGRLGGILLTYGKRDFTEWAVGLLDIQSDDAVLEVGFGPGLGIEILAEKAPRGYIAGVDYSREMVKQAKARNAQGIETGLVDLHYGSVEHLPFPDGRFRQVLSINSLQIWPDAVAGLREIRRVLETGGTVALGFTGPVLSRSDGTTELLTEAGFQGVHLQESERGVCALANA